MAQVILHQCDVCNKSEIQKDGNIPSDWFEFDYIYTSKIKQNSLQYLVCSLKCYIVMLDRCLKQSEEHSGVRIADMSTNFVRKLLERVDCTSLKKLQENSCTDRQTANSIALYHKEIKKEKAKNKSKIIIHQEFSCVKLDWLESFAKENSDERLITKMNFTWDNDNIVTYGSLIDTQLPLIPLIRHKNFYKLFIYEDKIPIFEQLKSLNS